MYRDHKSIILLVLLVLGFSITSCAKTVTPKVEAPPQINIQITFKEPVDTTDYDYFIIVGNNTTPLRNANFSTVPMYVPGYRPGITSILETDIEDTETHLSTNTSYFSSWSDIITYNDGFTNEFKGCTGLFETPESFESLEERCQSDTWLRGSTYFQNNGSSSTKINLKFDLNILTIFNSNPTSLFIGVLTVDKTVTQFGAGTLIDFVAEEVPQIDISSVANKITPDFSRPSSTITSNGPAMVTEIKVQRTL